MKYVDEFRDPKLAKHLIAQIKQLLSGDAFSERIPLKVMEFCGGHTHTIFRYGIEQLLTDKIELIHGPGCPVCVLPMGKVDDAVELAEQENVIFTTFGDAVRVPGSRKSLLQAKAEGADIRMVYSPMDALELARKNPEKEVIFFALGFETTMPSTALTVLQAKAERITNFSLFCNHITTPPTIKAILDSPDLDIDGLIAPGHVSMVIGEGPFQFISKTYQKPVVISGFEPIDILQSVYMLIKQFSEKRCQVENQYRRVVMKQGNQIGLQSINEVFEHRSFFQWRGLGAISQSGIKIRADYAVFDSEKKFHVSNLEISDPQICQCSDVLKGTIRPWQCSVYGNLCTPETPLGALMVSSEGACAAYYAYSNESRSKGNESITSNS